MAKHSDGSNEHPNRPGVRSVATMLIYLSTCADGGGATVLHRRPVKRKKNKNKRRDEGGEQVKVGESKKNHVGHHVNDGASGVIEAVTPTRNTVLIFPHAWPHEGREVRQHAKVALRAELFLAESL